MAKIYKTKTGQPYILLRSGRAKFIKKMRGTNTMVRHKRNIKRYFGGRSKKASGYFSEVPKILSAGLYGATREKISNALRPLTQNVPLGGIADEVVIGLTAIVLKRTVGRNIPILKEICNSALIIESARIGEALIQGRVQGQGLTTQSNPSW